MAQKSGKTEGKIKFEYDGELYVLEFDRDSIVATEKGLGVSLADIAARKVSALRDVFTGAFIKNHPGTGDDTIEAIWQSLGGKRELTAALSRMYGEGIQSLIGEPEKGKAISWTVE